jgi:hypothetical protein
LLRSIFVPKCGPIWTSRQQAVYANAPGYWPGFILNLFIIGSGFLTLGMAWTGVLWFLAAIVGVFWSGGLLWPVFAFGVLIHYYLAYNLKYKP